MLCNFGGVNPNNELVNPKNELVNPNNELVNPNNELVNPNNELVNPNNELECVTGGADLQAIPFPIIALPCPICYVVGLYTLNAVDP